MRDNMLAPHIHIVGCSPRSGTTLMQEMMVTCFEIAHYCEHERSLFKEELRSCGVTCTKHPREILYAAGALRANANLHVIYMVRDPRDVIVSRHANSPGQYFAGLGFYLRADRYAARLANHPRFVVVRYEDLVQAPDAVQDYIEQRLPFLKREHPFSAFHLHAKVSEDSSQALNGVRPPSAKDIGKWRHHQLRVSAQFKKFPSAVEVLIRHGYEDDAKWMMGLPEADDALANSVLSDRTGLASELRIAWRVAKRSARYWFKVRKTLVRLRRRSA